MYCISPKKDSSKASNTFKFQLPLSRGCKLFPNFCLKTKDTSSQTTESWSEILEQVQSQKKKQATRPPLSLALITLRTKYMCHVCCIKL